MLTTILLLSALSLILSLLLTPLVRNLAVRWKLVDHPEKRKVHTKPIPRVGGIAVVTAYFGAFLSFAAWLSHTGLGTSGEFTAVRAIAPAAALIFLIGLADDIFGLEPWHKFSVEILAGLLVVAAGVRIHDIAGIPVHPLIGTAATVLWLVACTNALNLIDGLDGLAAGVALLATTTILIAAFVSGNIGLIVATAPLMGALVGFLVFNSNPASIFLGDSGSLVLGFLLGSFSVLWSAGAVTVLEVTAPLLALAVPLLDTTIAITRRFLSGQPIFRPDRSHIHHRLLARGCSHRHAVLWLYLASGTAGLLSLCLIWAAPTWEPAVLVIFFGAAIYGIHQLRYSEFEAVRRVLSGDVVRREIGARVAVQELERGLTQAETAKECWNVIQHASQDFGVHAARMQLSTALFSSSQTGTVSRSLVMRISISEGSWIELFQGASLGAYPTGLVLFADSVRTILADKCLRMTFTPGLDAPYQPSVYGVVSSRFH
jgi:UDP-GlcNAc:undecaprenyl-phosphate GlcNAc-1-phosphate transferase